MHQRLLTTMIFFGKTMNAILRLTSEIFRTTWRRTGLAFGISILIHAVIVWMPQVHLPLAKVQLPPLSARLEILPDKVSTPDAIVQAEGKYEKTNRTNSPGIQSTGKALSRNPSTMKKMEKSDDSHRFPSHILLSYTVYKGAGNLRVGEAFHKLDVQSDRYILKAHKLTARTAGLVGQEQFIQTSQGVISEQGLHPETYKEELIAVGNKQDLKVNFDWESQALHFSNAADVNLPAAAQDAISFMYQFSKISIKKEIVPLTVVNTFGVEKNEFEVSRPEDVDLLAGKLRAVRLRKIHRKGEPYFEIWLGLEYRLLPVRFRQVDGEEVVIEESVISDIRVSDE